MPGATLGDVLGSRTIKPITRQELNTLAQSFPFQTFTPQQEFSLLPTSYRYYVNFAMYGFSMLFAFPELAGKSVTVSYVPATPTDQAIIDAYGGIFNVPAYLVRMKPQLKVEGVMMAEGQGVTLGSYQILRSSFLRPLGTAYESNDKYVTTGADYAVMLDYQRIPSNLLKARGERLEKLKGLSNPQAIVEEALHVTGLAYYIQADEWAERFSKVLRINWTREPSEAFVVQDLFVLYFWGLPLSVTRGSVGIDVKRNVVNPVSHLSDFAQERNFMLNTGSFGSTMEHVVFEQLYRVESVSTEKILALSSRLGIPIFVIDQSNLSQILPQLNTFSVVKQNIIEAVSNGWVAVVPQRNIRINSWSGAGWIIVDRQTGSAGYLIAGGLVTAGGSTTEDADISDFVDEAGKALGKIFSFLIITAGLEVIVESGAIIAVTVPGGLLVFGVGLAIVAVGAYTFYLFSQDGSYIIRKYWYA